MSDIPSETDVSLSSDTYGVRPAPPELPDHLAGLDASAPGSVIGVASEALCPRCKERPRHRYPSGALSGYCGPCNADKVRARSGYTPAIRACERCGTNYRGNSRRKVQLCPDCRKGFCATCGSPKSSGDKDHTECFRCRAVGKVCVTCKIRPRYGNRIRCWQCSNETGVESAKQRNRLYNLAPGQYEQMLAAQGGLCAISNQPETSVSAATGSTYPLAVDHDRACCPGNRSCGKCVRGLITRNMNVGLGMFNDDPALLRAAADYIEHHRTQMAS